MEERHREVLKTNWAKLRRDLKPADVVASINVLQQSDIERINAVTAQRGPMMGVDELLSNLRIRGPEAFRQFINALVKNGYKSLADDLLQDLQPADRADPFKTNKRDGMSAVCVTQPVQEPKEQTHIPPTLNNNGTVISDRLGLQQISCQPGIQEKKISRAETSSGGACNYEPAAITLENLPYALTEKLIGQLNERARWKAIAAHMKMTTKEVREIEFKGARQESLEKMYREMEHKLEEEMTTSDFENFKHHSQAYGISRKEHDCLETPKQLFDELLKKGKIVRGANYNFDNLKDILQSVQLESCKGIVEDYENKMALALSNSQGLPTGSHISGKKKDASPAEHMLMLIEKQRSVLDLHKSAMATVCTDIATSLEEEFPCLAQGQHQDIGVAVSTDPEVLDNTDGVAWKKGNGKMKDKTVRDDSRSPLSKLDISAKKILNVQPEMLETIQNNLSPPCNIEASPDSSLSNLMEYSPLDDISTPSGDTEISTTRRSLENVYLPVQARNLPVSAAGIATGNRTSSKEEGIHSKNTHGQKSPDGTGENRDSTALTRKTEVEKGSDTKTMQTDSKMCSSAKSMSWGSSAHNAFGQPSSESQGDAMSEGSEGGSGKDIDSIEIQKKAFAANFGDFEYRAVQVEESEDDIKTAAHKNPDLERAELEADIHRLRISHVSGAENLDESIADNNANFNNNNTNISEEFSSGVTESGSSVGGAHSVCTDSMTFLKQLQGPEDPQLAEVPRTVCGPHSMYTHSKMAPKHSGVTESVSSVEGSQLVGGPQSVHTDSVTVPKQLQEPEDPGLAEGPIKIDPLSLQRGYQRPAERTTGFRVDTAAAPPISTERITGVRAATAKAPPGPVEKTDKSKVKRSSEEEQESSFELSSFHSTLEDEDEEEAIVMATCRDNNAEDHGKGDQEVMPNRGDPTPLREYKTQEMSQHRTMQSLPQTSGTDSTSLPSSERPPHTFYAESESYESSQPVRRPSKKKNRLAARFPTADTEENLDKYPAQLIKHIPSSNVKLGSVEVACSGHQVAQSLDVNVSSTPRVAIISDADGCDFKEKLDPVEQRLAELEIMDPDASVELPTFHSS